MSNPRKTRPEIAIVANAFGAEAVRRDGHAAWLDLTAQAGASGFEVRRELFGHEAEASPEALHTLGAAIAGRALWSVYSSPSDLYSATGELNAAVLASAHAEADALGARWVKLQLGGFSGRAHARMIAGVTAGRRARLLVENGQCAQNGLLAQFVDLFAALAREGAPDVLGMTFDLGNWHWTGEAPFEAARALARHVEYIHCKSSAGEGARRFPVAPAMDDPSISTVFDLLPRHAPRGIEFALHHQALANDAQERVSWLAAI